MKVYILIESTGNYDSYYRRVHSVYSNLSKAESAKLELEHIATQTHNCQVCPCNGNCVDCEDEDTKCGSKECLNLRIKHAKENCEKADIIVADNMITCKNKIESYYDDYTYKIEGQIVIE